MSLSPEVFRGLDPVQIALVLAIDAGHTKKAEASKRGASCVNCMDTGMAGPRFCGCENGQKLGLQSFGDQP